MRAVIWPWGIEKRVDIDGGCISEKSGTRCAAALVAVDKILNGERGAVARRRKGRWCWVQSWYLDLAEAVGGKIRR